MSNEINELELELEGIRATLKQRLGSFTQLAEASGFTVGYVSLVILGHRKNPEVLELAKRLAATATKQQAEMKTMLNN